MANHASALKRARQSTKRRLHNRSIKSAYRLEIKKFKELIETKKTDEAQKMLPSIHKVIDKACTKGTMPKKTASRKKSNMTILLNKAAIAK